ncbi:MAG: hypothetical protein IJ719_02325 [Clostridia bacterium]|nr:hypothetical protein [Clostridia bacterium]
MERVQGRERLIRIGLWLFLFASVVSTINMMILPFGRANYHYSWILMILSFVVSMEMIGYADSRMEVLDEQQMKKASRIAGILYVVIFAIISLLAGYWMEYTPSGDNFMLYQASQKLARDGAFDIGSDFILYFCRFSNQWGFLLILTGIYRVLFALGIENTFYPLAVIQMFLYVLMFGSMFGISRRFDGNRGVLRVVVMLALCIPMLLASTVLYTDTFSMPFIIFSLEFALKTLSADTGRKRIMFALLCGSMVFIGAQIKMTVFIVLIAASILWLLQMPDSKQAFLCVLLSLALSAGGTVIVHNYVLDRYLDRSIYNQENTPIIHWVMMSIPDADNPYGGFSMDYALTWKMMDEGASHKEVMDSIYSRMKDKIYSLRYPNRLLLALFRKNSAIVADGTFGMTEMLDDRPIRRNIVSEIVLEDGRYNAIYSAIATGIWLSQMFLVCAQVFLELIARRYEKAMLEIAALGVLIFLMLWEARSRYIFGFVPVFLMIAALPGATIRMQSDGIANNR